MHNASLSAYQDRGETTKQISKLATSLPMGMFVPVVKYIFNLDELWLLDFDFPSLSFEIAELPHDLPEDMEAKNDKPTLGV